MKRSTHPSALDAALYLRKSRDPHNLASIEDQERLGREAAAAEGWNLAAVIDDAGLSASRFATAARPGWDELLGMLRAGKIGVIVFWESSRGDRKLTEWSGLLDECRNRGVLIHVVTHSRTYDLTNPRDWRTLAEDGIDSAYESEKISIRCRRGNAGAALRGEPYGPVPYGYRAVYSERTGKREGWEIVPGHAEIVRQIVTWIGHDKPVLALKRKLADEGVPTPSSVSGARGRNRRPAAEWSLEMLRQMAANPVYAGLRRMSDGTLAEGKWPEIVTRQQWRDACTALDKRRPMARPGKQKHLLSYLARCGECKSVLVVYTRKETVYYRCKKACFSVYYEWLNEYVERVICDRLSRPDAREFFKRDDSRSDAIAEEIATLKARRSEFRKKAASGAIAPDALAEIEAELNPEIARKAREQEALSVPPVLAEILGAEDVRAVWDGYAVTQKRAVIASITGVVVSRPPLQPNRKMIVSAGLVTFDGKPSGGVK